MCNRSKIGCPTAAILVSLLLCSAAEARFAPAQTFPKSQTAAVVDFDKDGATDIVNGLKILRNEKGRFVEVGAVPKTPNEKRQSGNQTAWADFDGDGVRDVLVFGFAQSRDRIRQVAKDRKTKKLTFSEGYDILGWDVPHIGKGSTYPDGEEALGYNQNATWGVAVADLDADGKPDLYLGRGRIGDMMSDPPEYFGKDWLVRNLSLPKQLNFADATNAVGMTPENQKQNGKYRHVEPVVAADYDMNGFPDFFVGHYRGSDNFFWRGGTNENGLFRIVNASSQLGVQSGTGINLSNAGGDSPMVFHGGGAAWLDFDNDGFLDLVEARLHHREGTRQTAVRLWRNNRRGGFEDQSAKIPGDTAATPANDWATGHYKCAAVGDFDNDGLTDIYLTRSVQYIPAQPREKLFAGGEHPLSLLTRGFGRLLRNTGDGFVDVTEEMNLHNPEHMDVFAAAMFDFDDDGKLDLFTCQGWGTKDGKSELWRNEGESQGNWLKVDLRPWENGRGTRKHNGSPVNSDAIGAIVQLCIDRNGNGQADDGEILTRLQQGNTTGGMYIGPQPLHFGLGKCDAKDILWLRVLWPGQKGVAPDGSWSDQWQSYKVEAVNKTMRLAL
jgi:hypothetical protein